MKKKKRYNPGFFLDMPFGEALERFVGTSKRELDAVLEKSKVKKPPGSKKKKGKRKPSGSSSQNTNVVRLSDRRKRNYS